MLNSSPQEVVTGPGPHLVYRAIGGRFDFYFLPGPTPNEVIQQYQQIIGRPYLPGKDTLNRAQILLFSLLGSGISGLF